MAQYKRKLSKGIRWWYKFSFNGKTYHSKAIYHTKTEAKTAETLHYKEVEEQARKPHLKNDMPLMELINERLDFVKLKRTNKYYKDCHLTYKRFLKSLGNIFISQITRRDINNFLAQEKKRPYTANYQLRLIKALFNHAIIELEMDINNPAKMKPYSINRKMKYIPTDKEIKALLADCTEEQALLVKFIRDTGARIGEAIRFRNEDIYKDHIILYTRKSKDGNLIPRKVPRPSYLKKRGKGKYFVYNHLPRFLNRKVSWGWHSLRHRYASKMSKEGLPLFEIMSRLGHSNLSTTQNYLQLLP